MWLLASDGRALAGYNTEQVKRIRFFASLMHKRVQAEDVVRSKQRKTCVSKVKAYIRSGNVSSLDGIDSHKGGWGSSLM